MSDHPSSGSRPLIPGQISSWLGVVAAAAAALIATGTAYTLVRRAPSADAQRRQEEKALRVDNNKQALELITQPARNADGTYRIPLNVARALIAADPKVIAKIQAAGTPAVSAAPAGSSTAAAYLPGPFVAADAEQMKRGAAVYARTCIACHQPTGKGLPPVFPSIAETPIVVGNPELPIKFITNGLMGPITVAGTTFNSMMPPVAGVTEQDIADVLTYVRQSFGNKGNPVSVDQVKAVRAANAARTAMWNTAELGLK
jgi:mono/diheme cytochrome c family protein